MLYNSNNTNPKFNVNFAGKIPRFNSGKSLNRLIETMAQTTDTKMEPVKYSMQRGTFVYLKDASGQNTVTSRLIPSYYNLDSDRYCIFFHDSFIVFCDSFYHFFPTSFYFFFHIFWNFNGTKMFSLIISIIFTAIWLGIWWGVGGLIDGFGGGDWFDGFESPYSYY